MDLRTAIIEQWHERFEHDKRYANNKIKKVNACKNTSDLLYHCMNIDAVGMQIISKKMNFPHLQVFIYIFRKIDQKVSLK